jgi:hypothetical protein
MIKKIVSSPKVSEIKSLIGFTALGFAMSLSSILFLFYFIGLNVYFFNRYFKTLNKIFLIQLLFFLPAIEISIRVLGVSIMPYEFGKYMCFIYFTIFSLDNRIHTPKIGKLFFILFLFVFPSILFIDLDNFQKKFVFSLMGILNLVLLGIYFSRISITLAELKIILKIFIYSAIPFLIILFIKSPSFSEMEFTLVANDKASGGFGPNQVSTFLGSAIFIFIIHQIAFRSGLFKSNRLIDFGLMAGFTLRALLTFSRGGIFTPILAFILPIHILSKFQNIQKIIKTFLIISIFATLTFLFVDTLTGGFLLSRFKGDTGGSQAGTSELSIDTYTSGRSNIIESDIEVWLDNFIFGVGPGESPDYRMANTNYVGNPLTHTEFTRLLSEHGLLGLVINLILIIIIPLKILGSKINAQIKYLKLAFVLFAIFTMAHSAMRTIIPVIFYAFSAVNIVHNKHIKFSPLNFSARNKV